MTASNPLEPVLDVLTRQYRRYLVGVTNSRVILVELSVVRRRVKRLVAEGPRARFVVGDRAPKERSGLDLKDADGRVYELDMPADMASEIKTAVGN